MSNCNNSNQSCTGNNIYVSGAETKTTIEVTNNKSRYYAELAENYKDKAKEYCDTARYYAEQNSDVSMSYIDNLENTLRNLIDGKQDTGDYAFASEIPSKTSDLTNDSGFAIVSQIPINNNQLTNGAGYITGISTSDVTSALTYVPADINLSNLSISGEKVIDGQWVISYLQLLTGETTLTANTTYTYSLSSYLPADGYSYEVLFAAAGTTRTTTNSTVKLCIGSSYVPDNRVVIAGANTLSNTAVWYGGNTTIPIGTDRNVTIRNDQASNCQCWNFSAVGYRRIGTNA